MNAQSAVLATATDPRRETGDRLATLFDAHQQALYRLARRLTNGADDARDLVQDTFVRAAQSIARIPYGDSPEEAWLVRVMINLRRDAWRRARTRTRLAHVAASEHAVSATQEHRAVAHAEIWRALDQLDPRRRAIVILHELDETPVEEIASLLGITKVTVRWHLSRARRELRRLLDSGGTR